MSFLLNTCLDVFDIHRANKTIDQDLGLLQAVNERLAAYGWLTNTGVKFVIVVDMAGRPPPPEEGIRRPPPVVGLRDSDLKPAFRAIQTAYVHLLQNPFYMPDDMTPMALARSQGRAAEIKNKKFISEMKRVGNAWALGVTSI
jgi:trafficking protein particle complex subunit 2